MTRLTTVEIFREDLSFSAGHFTIFSATEREMMHGHNYTVYTAITTAVGDDGLTFDYRYYKMRMREICKKINCTFILPMYSKHLKLEESGEYIYAHFDQDKIPFLKKDVTLLPITNSTIEELSQWFIKQLTDDREQELKQHRIEKILIKVFSSPGQSGSAIWEKIT